MKKPAQRIGHGLGLVVVIQAREISPTGISAQLDQSGAEHDAEQKPAKKPDWNLLRHHPGAAKENRKEAGFQQNRFPSETVERLPHIDEREIDQINGAPNHDREPRVARGDPANHKTRQNNADPRRKSKGNIARPPVKQTGRFTKRNLFDPERHWQKTVLAQ